MVKRSRSPAPLPANSAPPKVTAPTPRMKAGALERRSIISADFGQTFVGGDGFPFEHGLIVERRVRAADGDLCHANVLRHGIRDDDQLFEPIQSGLVGRSRPRMRVPQ